MLKEEPLMQCSECTSIFYSEDIADECPECENECLQAVSIEDGREYLIDSFYYMVAKEKAFSPTKAGEYYMPDLDEWQEEFNKEARKIMEYARSGKMDELKDLVEEGFKALENKDHPELMRITLILLEVEHHGGNLFDDNCEYSSEDLASIGGSVRENGFIEVFGYEAVCEFISEEQES